MNEAMIASVLEYRLTLPLSIVYIRGCEHNKLKISEKFAHGGIGSQIVGKNANWFVKVGA